MKQIVIVLVVSFALASAGFAEHGYYPSTPDAKDGHAAAPAARNRDSHGNLDKPGRNSTGLSERVADGSNLLPTGPGADYNPDGPQPGDLAWPGY